MQTKRIIACIVFMSTAISLYAGGGKDITPAATPIAAVETVDFSGWYLGAGLVRAKFVGCTGSCTYEDVTYGLMARGGYDFNRYIGIEGRYLYTSLGEGPLGGTPLMHAGIFLKPQFPLNERINLYGLLGYGYTKNLGNGGRLHYFDSDWGVSAGAGLEYRFSDKKNTDTEWRLFAEYQRLLMKDDTADMDVASLGIEYHF